MFTARSHPCILLLIPCLFGVSALKLSAEALSYIRKDTEPVLRPSPSWSLAPTTSLDNKDYVWDEDKLSYMDGLRMWRLVGGISFGWTYEDNVLLTRPDEDGKESESFLSASSYINLDYGPNAWGLAFNISYNPNYQWALNGNVDDAFNQSIGVNVNWTGARTRINLSTGFSDITGADIDVGDRVERTAADFFLGIAYDYSAKTTFGTTFSSELLNYDGDYFGSNSYLSSVYADYAITPKTRLGLSVGYSYTEVEGGVDYYDTNAQVRASWAASSRLSISASGGIQKTESDNFDDLDPIFELTGSYDLSGNGKTSASLSAYRSYHASAELLNQGYWSNGVSLSVSRAIVERARAAVAVGYEYATYEANAAEVIATREDGYFYIRPNFTYVITGRSSLTVYYQYSNNDSTGFGASSFERNSCGAMLTWAF